MEHHTKMGTNRFTKIIPGLSDHAEITQAGGGSAPASHSDTSQTRPHRTFFEMLNSKQNKYNYALNPYANKQFVVGRTGTGKAKIALTPDSPHILIHGAVGTGKTWLAQHLIDQALDKPFQGKTIPPQYRWQIVVITTCTAEWDKYTGNQNIRIFNANMDVLPEVSDWIAHLPQQTNTLLVIDRAFLVLEEQITDLREFLAPLLDNGTHLMVCKSLPLTPEWVQWLRPGNIAVCEARVPHVHNSLAETYPEFAMLETPPVQKEYAPKAVGSYWLALRTPRRLEPLVFTETFD